MSFLCDFGFGLHPSFLAYDRQRHQERRRNHKVLLLPSGRQPKKNWKALFGYVNLFRGLLNSVVVAVPATFLTGYFSAITAYAMAMYDFKGNKWLFKVIVIFMMIPGQLSLIGFTISARPFIWSQHVPLIIPAIASPGIVFS